MEFRVLGPLEVVSDGAPVALGGRRQRAVLAALLSAPDETVGRSRLIDLVWDEPPASAEGNLHGYVWKLREALRRDGDAGPRIVWSRGFRLRVEPGELDAWRFEEAAAEGRRALAEGRPADAVRAFRRALGLVRGEPFQDVDASVRFDTARTLLRDRVHGVSELYFQTRLDMGEHAGVIDELRAEHARHPLREGLAARLMLALYRSGRTGDALAVYREARDLIAGALGTEPGRELRDLHRRILRGDPDLDVATGAPVVRAVSQLPPALPTFSGRRTELSLLDGAGPVAVITGTPGVGKTALAVHWAHAARDLFPDGQLHVDLRGFTPGAADPVDPAEALRGFLDALGVPSNRIPEDLEGRAGRYRDLLSGKRMLIVLDNARDAAQVRPLLPGEPGCRVVITSRERLTGLVASAGAAVVPVEILPGEQARELLSARLGTARAEREPEAVGRIIGRCAGLPLALALVAAHAAARPHDQLADLADELDAAPALDGLHSTDPAMDPRTLFAWSYRRLGTAAARMFRLLGDHPGPDVSLPAAASLAGLEHGPARAALTELAEAHLLTRKPGGRYGRHDLLAAFAAELAAECAVDERNAALHRMHDHYLGTAHHAVLLVDSRRPSPPDGVPPPAERIDTDEQVWAWFAAEHPVLVNAVEHAQRHGLHGHAWRLAWTLTVFQLRTGRFADMAAAQRIAVQAAIDAGEPAGRVMAHRLLAHALYVAGQEAAGDAVFQDAVDFARSLGDKAAQADLILLKAWHRDEAGDLRTFIELSLRALALLQECGDLAMRARALCNIGWGTAKLGDLDAAVEHCRTALDLFAELGGQPHGEAGAWHTLGYVHRRLGEHAEAIAAYRKAIGIRRSVGYLLRMPEHLTELAEIHDELGEHEHAEEARREAVRVRAELG